VKRLVALLALLITITGCAKSTQGFARAGAREVDPAAFFAGEVPTYGQSLTSDDDALLAYLRALRRVDACGLLTAAGLAKIGEIGSVASFYAFDDCDFDIKVPGESERRYGSVEVSLVQLEDQPVEFRAAGLPVYEADPGSCVFLVPLDLSRLPGAPPPSGPVRPFVQLGLIPGGDCAFVKRLVLALAPDIAAMRVPLRDAVAVYPLAVAEHDPCEVLGALSERIGSWDVEASRPYQCNFTLRRNGSGDVPVKVTLEPQFYEAATELRTRVDRDGTELLVTQGSCSTAVFVGAQLRRKLIGGDYVPTGDLIFRPAVVVDAGLDGCDEAADVAVAAAKFFG
jgi:hypothetical protein